MRKSIADKELHLFYTSTAWLHLRSAVLDEDHHECQKCKEKGIYRRADTVHHINYVRNHPELALSKYYADENGIVKRNLISLCHNCHEEIHDYRQKKKKTFLTEERW